MALPIYIQIHNEIRKNIENGTWKLGIRIPSERELSAQFNVSRMTLRQAIQTLVDEGILEQRVGSGTFVSNEKVKEKMSGVTSFTDIMLAQGKEPSSKTISYHSLEPSLSEIEKLKIKQSDKVVRMERIRYGDGLPICFEIATVPEKIVQNLSKNDVTNSFYASLKHKLGLIPKVSKQTVSATLASEKIADYLDIKKGDAILLLRQTTSLQNGEPFEYVRTQYVGERFEFYLDSKKSTLE
ncbi:GntR family transcriptional regulator [Apilactobacillus micheneri]|uniref:GntR family transcriptional regulator n=1 Tax=Apilactobacillus micheneri TaxID=1899430 RepID=A0A2S2JMB0_9LACO|nr:GntR family transcriptional regulator [Apilactobacillus micheneri]TPR38744.1 GntR family transcriptional regulator [Apilactobacillus micheneri]TPR41235.1 GntR family transcriptional regulator [Apilactobacillus micheneri]TPR42387.1 GntR family transcriptional regulator [Apilactobacillus micheneri]TPR42783.1 GntR family transcriptional regulator [Apilactobacillus micheneri]TPR43551.1 GntR family transcriptional regulator [Apilactobacillus micheneri]